MLKVVKYFLVCIKFFEEMWLLVGESEYYKIVFVNENVVLYWLMVVVFLKLGCIEMVLNILEFVCVRLLVELMVI